MTMLNRISMQSPPTRVEIYRDFFIPNRPWHADVVFANGTRWKSWQQGFRTQGAMLKNIAAAAPDLPIERVADA